MALISMVLLVTGSLALLAVDVLAQPLSRRSLITGLILLILLPAVLLGQYAPPPYRLPYRWRWVLLGLQTLLTYLPVLLFEYSWLSLLGFLAGAVLLTVPRPASLVVALAVVASGPLLVHSSLVNTTRTGTSVLLSTTITGSSVYAVVHLTLLAARLQAAQKHTARLAEHRERARITQDLHDLLGSSLVSIALRSETALRDTPESTAAHRALRDIAALARGAHDEVRAVAHGHTSASLQTELSHVQRLLAGAAITTRTTLPPQPRLPAPVGNCLSALLREAVGNVLQHSRASQCEVVVEQDSSCVRLSVTNDGAPAATSDSATSGSAQPRGGTGLASLRFRVLALGGALETSHTGEHFRLVAELPLDPAVALGDADGVHEGARA
ncbi:histidine kinase [Streptomyces scopuliridis]|nr:histidine kinase [Streptomyces scopuliridis]WSB32495.1 histidine kinase [Streptomyces scopuliridis]WSB96742.1 histidine kinase [Streptomyces scopuliridis]WSC09555.1 histidine kinase [Streptomyces scopuliridis]